MAPYERMTSRIPYRGEERTAPADDRVLPFAGENTLEIVVREGTPSSGKQEIDKAGAICAYFICKLPFDC